MKLKVQNKVPFGETFYSYFRLLEMPPECLEPAHHYDPAYLAWQTVRKVRNPFFLNGTGFEGYFVGSCDTPDVMLSQILKTGHGILNAIARAYRLEYGFRSKLMKTLTGEASDPNAIHIWSAYLGATLARLRCTVLKSPVAMAFQRETYRLVSYQPMITYMMGNFRVSQAYTLDGGNFSNDRALEIDSAQLNPCDQDAWSVIEYIGQFGHPLVRQFLDRY